MYNKRRLKKIANKIAEQEKTIQTSISENEIKTAKAAIEEVIEELGILSLEEIFMLDELIQERMLA